MEIYEYRYQVKNIVLTLDKNYYMQDGSISKLYFEHDYMTRKMPIIQATLELSGEMIGILYRNKEKATISFDIYEQQLINSTSQVVGTTLYMQHSFSIIPAKDQTCYITATDTTTEAVKNQMQELQQFEMYLVDMNAVKWFTKQDCGIFQKASKPVILHALMQMRDIPSGITIASPPLDINQVNYVIIPLGDLVGNIDTLNKGYGLYNSYPIIYYDLFNMYCINWMQPDITIPNAKDFGTIVMILNNPVTPDQQVAGSCNDLINKTHYINLNDAPNIIDKTSKLSSRKFSTITSIDQAGTVNKQTVDEDATALTYVYQHNSMTMDQVVNESYIGAVLQVGVRNISIAFLKPYKSIMFDCDTQYQDLNLSNKIYRLRGWTVSIQREGVGAVPTYKHDVMIELMEPSATKTN